MRVAYLSQAGAIGGAERVLLDSIASLQELHPEWKPVLIAPADGPVTAEARALGAGIQVLPFPSALATIGESAPVSGLHLWLRLGRWGVSSPTVLMYANGLARTLRRLDPDIVHANGFKMQVLGAHAAPPRSAVVWHAHDFIARRLVTRRLLQATAKRCNAAIVNSECVANDLRAAIGSALPIRVVYNGVNLVRFAPRGDALDLDAISELAAAPSGTVRVGLVATGAHWKGQTTFLQALALLSRAIPVRGYVIGGPIYQTRDSQISLDGLRAQAERLGLGNRVGFTDYQRDIAAAMRALDIVVHTSIAPEPFGLVIAEAFACGRAVVTTGWGGAAEIIEAEVNAVTHRPGDAASLAAAIRRLVCDPSLRARLGTAARATAVNRLDRTRLGAEVAAVYNDVLRRNGQGDAATARS